MSTPDNLPPAPRPPIVAPNLMVFTPQGIQTFSASTMRPQITAHLSEATTFPVAVQWQMRPVDSDVWENLGPLQIETFSVLSLISPIRASKEYRVIVTNDAGGIISPTVTFSFVEE